MKADHSYHLRKIKREDLSLVLSWRNSLHIRNLSYNDRQISVDEHSEWFQKLETSDDRLCLIFEMDAKPMGVTQFFDIDRSHAVCKWGFYLGAEHPPKGLGTVMGSLALDYAFQNLGVEKICGEALSHNVTSIKFHEKLGFQQDGRIERHIFRDQQWFDVILFSLSHDVWRKNERRKSA